MTLQTNAILFGWNEVVRGREAAATELFTSALSFYEKAKASGKIEGFEPVFLRRHGGDLNGFFLIRGTHAQIDALECSDEFNDLVIRASHCVDGVGVCQAYTGQTVPDMMQRWTKAVPR
jgi:hypothetical protein